MQSFNSQQFIKSLTTQPGIYQMINANNDVIYVGKARNLKQRVKSYFQKSMPQKAHEMMNHVAKIEVIITNSENEALILECEFIKKLKPKYNILLRDDKGYPYIVLSGHEFPRLAIHRGKKDANATYFGPYPSVSAVRETLYILQKLFRIRSCKDSFFNGRSRPCLQYQIKRCTAPCVDYVSQEDYQEQIRMAELFLKGKSQEIITKLTQAMEQASNNLNFEIAAKKRDQIISLRRIQEQQFVSKQQGDIDVLAGQIKHGYACVQLLMIRAGRIIGNKTFFPQITNGSTLDELLTAFISQYYLNNEKHGALPQKLILNHPLDDERLIEDVLSQIRKKRVKLLSRVRGDNANWLKLAMNNVVSALSSRLANHTGMYRRFQALTKILKLDNTPTRIECFDISHTSGEETVASCVVFDQQGARKSDYRRFNIKNITGGDDYAAMRQALTRRYTRLKQSDGILPDLILIDGGKGQLSEAEKIIEELQLNIVTMIGVAKGPERKAGLETLILAHTRSELIISSDNEALHLIQQIRDEAHRFAITAHRQKRDKRRTTSILENIEGVGAKRRQALLIYFGGIQEIKRASIDEIAKVNGISSNLAKQIFDIFH